MNIQSPTSATKFAIGQPVLRNEDPKLLRGEGQYTDDIDLPGQAYAAIARSRHAHGVIRSLNTESARKMPGVLAVYTGADIAQYGPLKSNLPFKSRDGSDMKKPRRQALPSDKVRFVGDPVACVVAETLQQAKDAAEAIEVEIDPLPVVTKPTDATNKGAPLIYDDAPGNVALDFHYGDAEKVAAAFAKAKHVTRLKTSNQRMVVNTMEPRVAIGEFDPASDSIKVTDFRLSKLQGDQVTSLLKTTLNLRLGQTYIVGATKTPQSQRALMIVLIARR